MCSIVLTNVTHEVGVEDYRVSKVDSTLPTVVCCLLIMLLLMLLQGTPGDESHIATPAVEWPIRLVGFWV